MSITEAAKKYHERMFPGYKSKFLETDPEFIERFDNFAFDEVVNSDDLDDRTRMMAILATLIGSQSVDEFRAMVPAALNFGVTPVEVKEIHTAGVTTKSAELFNNLPPQDHFLESMADACKAVISYKGAENMLYINVANRLSVDCDCDSHPAEPEMEDLGIFASVDPVAVDQACYDAVVNSPDPGKKALIERMDSRHGIHTVEAAAQHGLGNREYEIISLDE
ncbi:MAG TPA: carboxymuconolactone decarboxylase family protein [Candidatus Blautia stercoripullorum]|uniref:Carboxymuconolactone decarboxylase family protein n=1 Tax=Candidatus Blautia stercoripullorum TaxID=2838502 RepID=A0A9D2R906_9FIRM|nr:carboxymuconolactone decarboxylase family protein [Candidatus Blautia stercoripullorum]